jgi:hypothetical protein
METILDFVFSMFILLSGLGLGLNLLNFKNTFVSACNDIRVDIQNRKFLLKSSLNEITLAGQFFITTVFSSPIKSGSHKIAENNCLKWR